MESPYAKLSERRVIMARVKKEPLCRLGYCAKKKFHFQGVVDNTVAEKYRNGICPICGGSTEKKYYLK